MLICNRCKKTEGETEIQEVGVRVSYVLDGELLEDVYSNPFKIIHACMDCAKALKKSVLQSCYIWELGEQLPTNPERQE